MTKGYVAAGVVVLLGSFGAIGLARATSTAVRVAAYVQPRVQVTTAGGPSELLIGEDDARRGFVELAGATFQVLSNCAYRLEIRLAAGPVTAALARFAGHTVDVGTDGRGSVDLPMDRRGRSATVLYRFVIAPGTLPGTYPWPARLVVQPMAH